MSAWAFTTLAAVSEEPQYGAVAKGTNAAVGPPFIRQTDIASGRIDWSSVPFCDLDPADFERYAVAPGDLLISRLGNGVGNAVTVREGRGAVFAGYLVRFRPKRGRSIPEFVGYQLQSPAWDQHVASYRSGAAQPTLNAKQMGEFRFAIPPIEEQRGIAATLGALDDKIESNRRIAERIDNLARLHFERWRQSVPVVHQTTFGEFADVYGGSTPKTAVPEYWDGVLQWATPTDVTRLSSPYLSRTARQITEAGLASCTAVMHPVGTIFMTSRATIGAFAVNQVPAATNQGFVAVRPRESNHRWFLFEEMRSRVIDIIDSANGSTFLEISRGNFKALSLAVPSDADLATLARLLDPLHACAAAAATESERIAALRDALLPELLSGRIRVPEAREAVAEATA